MEVAMCLINTLHIENASLSYAMYAISNVQMVVQWW